MIAYLSGLLAVALLPELSYVWMPLSFGLAACCIRRLRGLGLIFILGCLLGFLWGAWQLHHRLPDHLARVDLPLSGTVLTLSQTDNNRQSFILAVESAETDDAALRRLRQIKLSYYDGARILQAGDHIKAVVRLFPLHGLSNPEAFDLEKRYLQQGIDARGYIRTLINWRPADWGLLSLRQSIANRLDSLFTPTAAVTLRALVLGDRGRLTDEQWQLISETGTAHLMVVSGLHIAVMAGLGLLLAKALGLVLSCLGVSSVGLRRLGLILAALLALGYALLSGMAIPVQRALVMVLIFLAGEWTLKSVSGWLRWRWALVVVTLLQPLAVTEPGAWLSFGAVAILLWILGKREGRSGMASSWWRIQCALFVGMLPVTATLFSQIGFLGPIANLVAVPIVSIAVMALPLALPIVLLTENLWLANEMSLLIELFWVALQGMRDQMGLYLSLPSPSIGAVVLASVATFWWLQPFPRSWRWPALLLFFPLLTASPVMPDRDEFDVTLFDVGQGLAVLIETQDKRLMYDTGPSYGGAGSAYPYAIAPLLEARGVDDLDLLVLSHGDSDHTGGAAAMLQRVSASERVVGQPVGGVAATRFCSDQSIEWQWSGVKFELVQAAPTATQKDNDLSCVLHVSNGTCSLLIPGDLGTRGERVFVQRSAKDPVTWLVAGHHGSSTSSSQLFLNRLSPEVVIFSRGAFNRFGHPATEVVDRVKKSGIGILDTARDGAILLHAGKTCTAQRWRKSKRRYWTAS